MKLDHTIHCKSGDTCIVCSKSHRAGLWGRFLQAQLFPDYAFIPVGCYYYIRPDTDVSLRSTDLRKPACTLTLQFVQRRVCMNSCKTRIKFLKQKIIKEQPCSGEARRMAHLVFSE